MVIYRGPQPYVGSSLGEACQCLQLKCLCQAFCGRDWAGRGGQHRSHADPAVTFGQGTYRGLGAKH